MTKRSADAPLASNRKAADSPKDTSRTTPRARVHSSIRTDLPQNPTVRVIFHGLMALCFKPGRHFEIGFLNGVPRHDLKIIVWDPLSHRLSSCRLMHLIPGVDVSTTMRLSVKGAAIKGLWFYQQKGEFKRDCKNDDPRDFRWSLDLEGPAFYDYKLRKRRMRLKPRLRLTNGVFHTAYRTNSKFKVKKGKAERAIGCVGEYMAVNIYLKSGGSVSLKIGETELRFKEGGGKKYQIDFLNECPPKSLVDPENDFHHYLEAFDLPSGEDPCELLVTEIADPSLPDFCYFKDVLFSSDKSPCTMANLGLSDNLDS